ncbi:hypothetical protein ACSBR1_000902 [Camellia fascicularis]
MISILDGRTMYNDIVKATKDFDATYCIGKGRYGIVYKGKLQSANIVAMNKHHPLSKKADRKDFFNEVRALTEIKHQNIVKLFGFFYEYHERVSYMHHDCTPPIVHRDISNNNVLINEEYEAHVSDFGTAKLLKLDSSN